MPPISARSSRACESSPSSGHPLFGVRGLGATQDGHAVVRLLTPDRRMVARRLNGLVRKCLVGGLDFLEADNVRLDPLKPAQQPLLPGADRIDVPCSYFHGLLCPAVAVNSLHPITTLSTDLLGRLPNHNQAMGDNVRWQANDSSQPVHPILPRIDAAPAGTVPGRGPPAEGFP